MKHCRGVRGSEGYAIPDAGWPGYAKQFLKDATYSHEHAHLYLSIYRSISLSLFLSLSLYIYIYIHT